MPPMPPPPEMFIDNPRHPSDFGGQFAEIREREPAMAEEGRSMLGSGYPHLTPPPRSQGRSGNPAGTPTRGGGQPAGPRAPWAGTPRNASCPCGSGKKFKHCHGRI